MSLTPNTKLGLDLGCSIYESLSSTLQHDTLSPMLPSAQMVWTLLWRAPEVWDCTAGEAAGGACLGMSVKKGRSWYR